MHLMAKISSSDNLTDCGQTALLTPYSTGPPLQYIGFKYFIYTFTTYIHSTITALIYILNTS